MPRGHVLPNSEVLAALRGEAGLTQDELASRAGYGLRTIGKIERGQPTTSFTLSTIATVLADCLGRRIEVVDLLRQRLGESNGSRTPAGTFIVAEHVKLLDVDVRRTAGKDKSGDTAVLAVLIDTLALRYVPHPQAEMLLHYATTGTALEGRSLSHPQHSQWQELAAGHSSAPCAHLGRGGTLRTRLPANSAGRLLLQNRVEYSDAFTKPEQRWFHAHILYPTDSLTMLVRFPEGRPYRSLRGLCQRRSAGPLATAPEQPVEIAAGQLAYWRIAAPTPGETYQLCWT